MMKIFNYLLLILIISSCKTRNENNAIHFLDQALKVSYLHFFESTIEVGENYQLYKDAVILKNKSDSILKQRTIDKTDYFNYHNFLTRLWEKYEFLIIPDETISFYGIEKNTITLQIKTLEYITINSLIKSHYSNQFCYNFEQILVVPEKDEVNVGETYIARFYLTVDNHHNPYKIVVDGDTIASDYAFGFPPVFKNTAIHKGITNHKAQLLIKERGKYEVFDFLITYKVR